MNNQAKSDLPHYRNPPLNEVAFSVQFMAPASFKLAHMGLFWSLIREQFPTTDTRPPISSPNGELAVDHTTQMPWLRCWFVSADDSRIFQIQQDRLVFNWRNRKLGEYPRFEALLEEFRNLVVRFSDFVVEQTGNPFVSTSCELAYVNILNEGADYPTGAEIEKTVSCVSWNDSSWQFFCGKPKIFAWEAAFDMPGAEGILRTKLSYENSRPNPEEGKFITFDLTAVKPFSPALDMSFLDWFEHAHVAIVKTFADMTSLSVQKNSWGLYD